MDVFTIAESGDGPCGIATGADGALWCALNQTGAVARITPHGAGTVWTALKTGVAARL